MRCSGAGWVRHDPVRHDFASRISCQVFRVSCLVGGLCAGCDASECGAVVCGAKYQGPNVGGAGWVRGRLHLTVMILHRQFMSRVSRLASRVSQEVCAVRCAGCDAMCRGPNVNVNMMVTIV